MKNILGLVLILSIFWLVNSGHFGALLLSLGVLSVAGVVLINKRMEAVDGGYESPVLLSLRLPAYLLWLTWEIIKSNIEVSGYIWLRTSAIKPTVFKVTADQKTDVCKVLYANSIIMTPGTLTLDVQDNVFEVHALTGDFAETLKQGEMNRRVKGLEE